ncbi:hypothetical protein F4810DRAFT_510374 [Camillea tinctor]|nr:hypothetical protein F4810DRAFT_510374 [Camillea tinctor]
MSEVLFGEDFGFTRSKYMHPGIIHHDQALSILSPLEGAIWLARLVFSLKLFIGRVKDWFQMVDFCDDQMRTRVQQKKNPLKLNIALFFLEEDHRTSQTIDNQRWDLVLKGTVMSAVVAGRFVLSTQFDISRYIPPTN